MILDQFDNSEKAKELLIKIAENKHSEFENLKFTPKNKLAELDALDFGDPINRKFPLKTKGDAILSAEFFSSTVGNPAYNDVPIGDKIKLAENIKHALTLHNLPINPVINFLTYKTGEYYAFSEFPNFVDKQTIKFLMTKEGQAGLKALSNEQKNLLMIKIGSLLGIDYTPKKEAEDNITEQELKEIVKENPDHWEALNTDQKLELLKKSNTRPKLDKKKLASFLTLKVKNAQFRNKVKKIAESVAAENSIDKIIKLIRILNSMDDYISPKMDATDIFFPLMSPEPPQKKDLINEILISKFNDIASALSGIYQPAQLELLRTDPFEFWKNAPSHTRAVIIKITNIPSSGFEDIEDIDDEDSEDELDNLFLD
ncbi:MAG: hypothetical protein ACP5LM_04180 [Thermoplasmata archaeon]